MAKRTGLGRGIGALIPTADQAERPVDVFFPESDTQQTTAVAVATDGEWIRRRVGSPEAIRKLASKIATPAYDVQIVGYPQRMRDWNARNKRDRSLE